MNAAIKVQYDVPLPPIKRRKRAEPRPRVIPVDSIQVGGFMFLPGRKVSSVSAYLCRIGKEMGMEFRTRHEWALDKGNGDWVLCEPDVKNAVEGVGAWRTK